MGLCCSSAPRREEFYATEPDMRRRIEEARRRAREHHERVGRDTRDAVHRSDLNPMGWVFDELARKKRRRARDAPE